MCPKFSPVCFTFPHTRSCVCFSIKNFYDSKKNYDSKYSKEPIIFGGKNKYTYVCKFTYGCWNSAYDVNLNYKKAVIVCSKFSHVCFAFLAARSYICFSIKLICYDYF